MEKYINSVLINIGLTLLFYLVFIVFTSASNYFDNKIIPSLIISVLYILVLFLLVRYFNSTIYGITVEQFIGKKHLLGIFLSLFSIIIVFLVPYLFFPDTYFTIAWDKATIEAILTNIIVGISEELIFRAFFFLSLLTIFRYNIVSAILSTIFFHIFLNLVIGYVNIDAVQFESYIICQVITISTIALALIVISNTRVSTIDLPN